MSAESRSRWCQRRTFGLATLIVALAAPAGHAADPVASPQPEQQFNQAVELLREGRSGDALSTLEALTRRAPDFQPAQTFYGELLAAVSGVRTDSGQGLAADPRLADLAEEARLRLASQQAVPADGTVPASLLQLSPSFRHAIVVDLPRARLYLLSNDNGHLQLQRHNYAAMGRNGAGKQTAGDMRTPIGLYHITRWIAGDALPDLYGAGAFPLDYPNAWDRKQHRSGSGIWLHGVPADTYSRPPRSSEGCVTMANGDLQALRPYVRLGQTPVVLSDGIEWVPADAVQAERKAFLARIEDWRERWSSLDTDRYLALYADDFSADGMDRAAFAAHKRRVNARKRFIDVQLHDVSLFRYPGTDDHLQVAEFTMDYRSSNYSTTTRKQQFWRRQDDGSWLIVREVNR